MTRFVEIPEIHHVQQKVVDPKRGDCMQACVASLLRLPLEVVPDFHGNEGWDWLLGQGIWTEFTHRMEDGTYQRRPGDTGIPSGYTIASVDSAIYPGGKHAVICLDGKVVWDPSPYAAERTKPYDPIDHYIQLYYTESHQ